MPVSLDPLKPPYFETIYDGDGKISRIWLSYFQSLGSQIATGAVNLVSGVPHRTTITGTQPLPVVDIANDYEGQNSITRVGTIDIGTWHGSPIADAYISSAATWNAKLTNPMTTAGDLILGGAAGAAGRLGIGANTYILTSNGTTASWQPASGSVSPANPTASVGLAVVNGSASTYMRSDAAPALSQAISPTWSGTHTFSNTIAGSINGNAATATALQTARAINGVNFDGTAPITVTASAGTLTGATLAANVLASSLTSVGTLAALTVTATISGSINGNAATATALQTARAINGVNFDGTGAITVTAAAGTLTGTTLNATVVSSSLTSVGTIATGVWSGTAIADGKIASALTGKTYNGLTLTALSTGFTIAGGTTSKTLTVPLDASVSGTNTGDQTTISGNAATATALQTARNINGVSFDGTADITVAAAAGTLTGATLASGVLASSLTSVGTLASLTVTATISGSINGNAATVTTNANLTGPITSVGNATAITNSAVTLAKIANQADQTILGNNTGGAAAPVALTAAQTKTVLALGNVENTALSTWAGTSNIVTIGTLTNDLLFTDATYDIGKSGATRPRDLFVSRNGTVGGTLTVTGKTTHTGAVAIGTSPGTQASLEIQNTGNAGTTQYGLVTTVSFGTGATNTGINNYNQFVASGSFTMGTGRAIYIASPSITTATITELIGLEIANQSGGGTNRAMKIGTGLITFGDTTDATTASTGGLVTSGGVGIAKALWVGGLANIAGVVTTGDVTDSSSSTTGSVIVAGGMGIAKKLFLGSTLTVASSLTVSSTTDSTTTSTGAIHTSGGVGVNKALFVGGDGSFASNLILSAAGGGLKIKEGTNATMGVVTLVLGVATVSTTKVTASSRIFLSVESLGTIASPVAVSVTARSAGTSFTITSANLTDTSSVAWHIIEPAP